MSFITKIFNSEQETKNEICPSLSFQQRIYGFFITLFIGFLCGAMSYVSAARGDWTQFALLITCSNIISLCSSLFLYGPVTQVKRMFKETRWIATTVVIFAMIATIIAAIYKMIALCIVFSIIQYLAIIWYGLSYIPFARDIVKSCCKTTVTNVV
jgi:hypothetical protein